MEGTGKQQNKLKRARNRWAPLYQYKHVNNPTLSRILPTTHPPQIPNPTPFLILSHAHNTPLRGTRLPLSLPRTQHTFARYSTSSFSPTHTTHLGAVLDANLHGRLIGKGIHTRHQRCLGRKHTRHLAFVLGRALAHHRCMVQQPVLGRVVLGLQRAARRQGGRLGGR